MSRTFMLAALVAGLLAAGGVDCQAGSGTSAAPDARKDDHVDKRKESRPSTRGDGRWYLQRPSSY